MITQLKKYDKVGRSHHIKSYQVVKAYVLIVHHNVMRINVTLYNIEDGHFCKFIKHFLQYINF